MYNKNLFSVLWVALAMASCSNHPSFNSPQEAVEECHNILDEMRSMKDIDTKRLAQLTAQWLETQDSSYSVFGKDSSITLRSPVAYAFFSISDSVRQEVSRLAFSKPRSLKEVMYLKINSSPERSNVLSSSTYKNAVDFFDKLDDVAPYRSLPSTLTAYYNLLRTTRTFKQEQQFMDFIKEEDRCFRSLMNHLNKVSDKDMQKLTSATSAIFDNLYASVGKKTDDVNDRTMLYLTLRFNRRIIQNAIACRNNIVGNAMLSDVQRANYKWMLIQPFMAIDDYSIAALTDKQQKILLDLTEELPTLLSRLDMHRKNEQEEKKLTQVLSTFFLKSYLSTTL